MSILKIARMGHPVLSAPAEPVEVTPGFPVAPEVGHLVLDMLETLEDAGGVGLAAPQVHAPLRLVIFHIPQVRAAAGRYRRAGLDETQGEVPLTVLINPVVEPLDDEMIENWESCLSLPGMTGLVPRHPRIRYRGMDPAGETVERTAEGFHARVVQHECDHLDGVLYPQRITDLSQFGFADEIRQRWRAQDGEAEDTENKDSRSPEQESARQERARP